MSGTAERYHTVARVGTIPEGKGQPFEIEGRVIAVFLDEGVHFAIDDACPHQGAPLCDGIVAHQTVSCTWHGWCFRLTDGRWTENPRFLVGTYPVRVIDDAIQVGIV